MLMITDGTAGMNRTRNYFSLLTDMHLCTYCTGSVIHSRYGNLFRIVEINQYTQSPL